MKRCIVITFPYSLGTPGGGPLDCVEMAAHLAETGAKVILLAVATSSHSRFPRPAPCESEEQEARLRQHSVEVVRVPAHPALYRLDGLPVREAVKALLARRRVDALLGWYHEVAFLPGVLRPRNVVFGIIAAASYARPPRRNPFAAWIDRKLDDRLLGKPLRRADVVFARSAFTGREVVERFGVDGRRVRVTYCGVTPRFSAIPRSFTGDVRRLIFYGAWTRAKGLFEAMEALGRVAAEGRRDWTLKIAGWGSEERVRRVAAQHGIADCVELLGPLDHAALARELQWAQLAILPSHAESFGLANAEAQASGLPVVAYAVGAVPEVVENNVTGWLAPPGRVELLAQAVQAAMADPHRTLRAGLAGRERVARLFSWPRTAAAMREGIEQALEAKSRA